MVLEATMICVDNSEYMRNGDFAPSRFEAERDAVNLLFGARLNSHPENTVGLLTMAEKREVLCTLTNDIGKLLTRLHHVKIGGTIDFAACIQIAQLALKYRQAKNHPQRIIAFVGSPIQEDEKELVKLAKKLKKNNVHVDVVNFGEDETNTKKLEAFINAVDRDRNSHLVTVPAGVGILSDALVSSPIAGGEGGAGGGAGGEFGIDANMDPELALALRVSLEEERARQGQAATSTGASGGAPAPSAAGSGLAPMQADQPAAPMNPDAMTEEEQIQYALRMSLQETAPAAPSAPAAPPAAVAAAATASSASEPTPMDTAAGSAPQAQAEPAAAAAAPQDMFSDPAFLSAVLGSLPGVDPNDEQIRSVLASFQGAPGEKKEDSKKDEGKK